MRIALYTPNYPGITGEGGIGTYTRDIAHGLCKLGHNVHVLTPGERASIDDGPVHVHFTRTDHLRGFDRVIPGIGACWRVAMSMRKLVKDHEIQLVEFPNWEGYGLIFQKISRIPVVVRLSTSSNEAYAIDGGVLSRLKRWDIIRERWLVCAAKTLATHSAAHGRTMAEETGVQVERIRVQPLGVEVYPDWVCPARTPGPPTVVYLGRLEHRKGTVELLQSVPEILRQVPEAQFILIGSDRPHCPGGRTHAEYLKDFPVEVRKQVTLAGRLPQPEVDRLLQTADLFVAPSRYESFGLIFLEAMRWGTPVVGTTAGGIPEIVENGKTGVLVQPESPIELAAAIAGLLLDPERRATLGAAGRRRVEQEFSLRRMAEQAEQLYKEVLQSRIANRIS